METIVSRELQQRNTVALCYAQCFGNHAATLGSEPVDWR